jgi:hypothetical protein
MIAEDSESYSEGAIPESLTCEDVSAGDVDGIRQMQSERVGYVPKATSWEMRLPSETMRA